MPVSYASFISFIPVSNIAAVISYPHMHIFSYGPEHSVTTDFMRQSTPTMALSHSTNC